VNRKRPPDRRVIALFIDVANMCESDMDWIVRCVRRHGKPAIARAYGNFVNWRFLETAAEKLFLQDVLLVHCPGWRNGGGEWKDCADEMMMGDIQQALAERPEIGRYIVCTGDAHFVPVVKRIRACGREAIVVAPADGPSRMLQRVADKFLIAPPLNAEPTSTDASLPTEDRAKTSEETPVSFGRSSTSGTNGDSRWRKQVNGLPQPHKPGVPPGSANPA
jgi:hypothetical protein